MGSRAPLGNGGGKFGSRWKENRVTIQLTSRSKQEMREIKRKLVSELELVRRLVKKIEEGGSKPLHQLGISVLENDEDKSQNVDKDKRTQKANQFHRKSSVLAKHRSPAGESHTKSKSGGKKQVGVQPKFSNKLFKSCGNLLERLMKHKHGWVFNIPVDPFALGLHDYFDIIKHPMDLGTVKSRLDKNWYNSPMEFAEDVRLTFHNAMTYNPKGQDVHAMAELLLKLFEEKWKRIEVDYIRESRLPVNNEVGLPTPLAKPARPLSLPAPERRPASNKSKTPAPTLDPKAPPSNLSATGRTPSLKKPKAKDLNKREMTYDEKQKLSLNLQNLPSEKLYSVVQIIKKRNPSLSQKDDEIEVDIDTFDTETLWELDRFLTNYKKGLSKNKRKAEFPNQGRTEDELNVQDKNIAPFVADPPNEAKQNEGNTSAVSMPQMEKKAEEQVAHAGKSSSSSSSSSISGSNSLKKPKAKDLNRREMTYDEKQKLSLNLQNLPSEKMHNIVQIIKKRNPSLSQQDDEIEVDIDTFDTETLWELDRFVTNYEKGLSKKKRKAESPNQERTGEELNVQNNNIAPIVVDLPEEAKKDEGNASVDSLPQMEEEVAHVDKSRSSSSSSSISGSPSLKKHKAEHLNKRKMTYDERQKLSLNLQNLSSENMDNVVQIIKRRNPSLSQNDDEIELDIDTFDTETLWELDRFVTNYEIGLSNNQSKAEFSNQGRTGDELNVQGNIAPIVVDLPEEAKKDEGNTSVASLPQMEKQMEEQVAHVDASRSSSSSSSISGSPSLTKQKSKHLNKREMTYDEKQKLSLNLQKLPSEYMDNVVQIIKKRNPSLSQKDDEIELDIDTFDTETLWELHWLVTNYNKGLRKNKRKAESPNQGRTGEELNVQDKNIAPMVVDSHEDAIKNEGNTSAASPPQMEKQVEVQVAHVDKPSNSSSSSSMSGSPSSKKPKAEDLNKREMTYDEKQKLSLDLQNLPSEMMYNVVQIIKKRNPSLSQKDDEIEVDIDTFDPETLWELDRFVTTYKKGLSMNERKAESPNRGRTGEELNVQDITPNVVDTPEEAKMDEGASAASPFQMEKQVEEQVPHVDESSSSSSSSSTSGSSSSDSDSDSSSEAGSDAGCSSKT